ncbi:hypothetical protein EXIGLDRAFT_711915 [Exidia glandulosa HHB12029]|uniref:Uncharacterized protein n=1 Tax=Exidia glandulosa HHB12029 TaxID=1314781 RepID=A0A165EJR6_EXIGL|nr:hypothetical protein EXIGLDRAFT_711915 [Exidia glandulosa HHB12029]
MKDTSSQLKATRQTAYPKKRPSPTVRDGAITKRKQSPVAAAIVASLLPRLESEERQRKLLALAERKLLEEEYRSEIRRYMHDMELATMSSAQSMDQQPEIRWEMRPCLVDFLVETHLSFRLRPETLYLTLNIIDRYVSRRIVYTKHYQLVGCTALWIAAKFEDAKDRVPTADELCQLCRGAYDQSAFTQMEIHVLNTIGWMVGHPTAEAWLRIACCGAGVEDTKTQHVARFLMEISLFHREYIAYPSSAVASGALCLARHIMGKMRRPQDESELGLEVVDLIDNHLVSHAHELSETLVKKYSMPYYSKASTHVLGYYLKGNRFVHQALATCPPITPMALSMSSPRTPVSSISSRSSVLSSGSSSEADDMPITPGSPTFGLDPFSTSSSYGVSNGKENMAPDVFSAKHHRDDGIELASVGPIARMALLEINGIGTSPRGRAVEIS